MDCFGMTTKIELKSMRFYAYHGVDPQETRVGNWFIVDLMVTVDLVQAIENDNLDSTVNYAEIYEVVKSEMNIPSKLIEHAAGRILKSLRRRFPQIEHIQLKLAKQNPPFGGDVQSAAILLED